MSRRRGAGRARGGWAEPGLAAAVVLLTRTAGANAPAPVSLQEAVQRALAQNPTFQTARQEILRAEGLLEQARAQALPSVGATGSLIQLNASRVFSGFVTQPASQANVTGTLTLPLVNPRAWALWSQAGENVKVARTGAYDTRRVVAVAVGHAYLSVLAQKRVLDANVRSRDTARAHFEDAHARFVVGAGNRVDEVRARQVLAADEALVETSHAAVVTAQEALGVLAGVEAPLDAEGDPDLAPVPTLDQGLAMAATSRSDVVAADERRIFAREVHRDAWTVIAPSLTGSFDAFYQEPATSFLPTTGWQAELLLSVPIFDGGYTFGVAKEKAALQREAEIALTGVIRQARSDVRASYETLSRARTALSNAREASQLAKEALTLAGRAYVAGAFTNIEVIDAEQTSRDADIAAEVAADTERQAALDALAAVGLFP